MFDTPIEKGVGEGYSIICDRATHIVSIYFKGKEKKKFYFQKLGHAVTFYARLETVKAIKDSDIHAAKYEGREVLP